MRICYVMPSIERYSPVSGGALATCAMQQARYMLSRGHEVFVLSGVFDESYPIGTVIPVRVETRDSLNKARRAISRLRRAAHGWDGMYYEYYLSSLTKSLRRLEPAPDGIVLFNDLITPRYAKRAVPSARVLLRMSNELTTSDSNMQATREAVHKFVCVSDYIRRWTIAKYGIPEESIVTVPNGADVVTFRPRDGYLERSEPVRVLYLGRLTPDKGPEVVARTVASLQLEGLKVSLTVAGGVWWYGNENQMADPWVKGLMETLDSVGARYTGHVSRPNIPALIREHDIVCVLSLCNDPMPQVAFEAMASGCAVLASNRGGIPEACGDAAVLVDPEDSPAVVDAMRRLIVDSERLNRYKQSGLARAQAATWSKNAMAFEEMLAGQQA